MAGYQITVDCTDPDRLARFWAEALGYRPEEPPDGLATWREYWVSVGVPVDEAELGYEPVVDPAGARPRIWFQHVPEPKAVKNRLHFDLLVGGGRSVPLEERKRRVRAEADRLARLGAVELRAVDTTGHFFVAMADPEGNEFDIV